MSFADQYGKDVYFAGTLAVSLFTAHYVSHRNEAIRRAGATLPPPIPPPKKVVPEPNVAPPSTGRKFGRGVWGFMKALVRILTPAIFIGFVFPRIGSQLVVDGFTLAFWLWTSYTIYSTAWVIFENGVSWSWRGKKPYLGVTSLSPSRAKWARPVFGATLTAMSTAMAYYDLNYLSFILAAAPVMTITQGAGMPPIKWLCKVVAIIVAAFGAIAAIIAGALAIWKDDLQRTLDSPEDVPEVNNTTPSQWIFNMATPIMAIGSFIGVMYLSMTLRFEVAQYGSINLDEGPCAETAKIVYIDDKPTAAIGKHHTFTHKPLFNAGMVALVMTHVLAYTIGGEWPAKNRNAEIANIQAVLVISMFIIPATIALRAWATGRFKEWYNWEEPSLYQGDETVDTQAMDDVENLLDAVDEKK